MQLSESSSIFKSIIEPELLLKSNSYSPVAPSTIHSKLVLNLKRVPGRDCIPNFTIGTQLAKAEPEIKLPLYKLGG